MSRAYRIRVRESIQRVLRGEDRVSTQLEILEILPGPEMANLLAAELERRGFRGDGKELVREDKGVTVRVEPATSTVTVAAEVKEDVQIEATRDDWAYDDVGPNAKAVREGLKKQVKKELQQQADQKAARLQRQATDELEGRLGDLRQELNGVVNRVTAEALKIKAAQLGRIKEMTEDPQAGSLTIVVEV
jgi:hypothetical protein